MEMSSQGEESFWARMNQVCSSHDLPQMPSSPRRPSILPLEVLVCTYAGKPLANFVYPPTCPERPFQSLATLCAVTAAYQASNAVRDITTSSGRLVSVAHECFHVIAFSRDRHCSLPILRTLVRSALTAVYATMSSEFVSHLDSSPNADTTNLVPRIRPLLDALLLDVITYPVPYVFQKPVILPASISLKANPVAPMLHSALTRFPSITHAIVITASAPFPHRLISFAAPANRQLSSTDLITLMSIPALRAVGKFAVSQLLFLHTDAFRIPCCVHARMFEPRLNPDDYEAFRKAVGGAAWRPEWTSSASDSVWLLALSTPSSKDADRFLDFVEKSLDRTAAARDLMVRMERSWTINDIAYIPEQVRRSIKGLFLMDKHQLAGTVGGFTHECGVAIVACMLQNGEHLVKQTSRWKALRLPHLRLTAVCWEQRYIVISRDCIGLDQIVDTMERLIVPWVRKNIDSLMPTPDTTTVQPATLLPGFLAPFDS